MSDDVSNPWRAPESASFTGDFVLPPGIPLARGRFVAELLHRRWLFRRIRVLGAVQADIEWNARLPRETLRVNGEVRAQEYGWQNCVPRFETAAVIDQQGLQIQLDVDVLLGVWTRGLCLRVNRQSVYIEGDQSRIETRLSGR